MATINLNLPDALLRVIEKRARGQGVSIEEQIRRDLALVETDSQALSESDLLAYIRSEREVLAGKGVFVSDDDLRAAKKWGRD
jgi:hypothetical protein